MAAATDVIVIPKPQDTSAAKILRWIARAPVHIVLAVLELVRHHAVHAEQLEERSLRLDDAGVRGDEVENAEAEVADREARFADGSPRAKRA